MTGRFGAFSSPLEAAGGTLLLSDRGRARKSPMPRRAKEAAAEEVRLFIYSDNYIVQAEFFVSHAEILINIQTLKKKESLF